MREFASVTLLEELNGIPKDTPLDWNETVGKWVPPDCVDLIAQGWHSDYIKNHPELFETIDL